MKAMHESRKRNRARAVLLLPLLIGLHVFSVGAGASEPRARLAGAGRHEYNNEGTPPEGRRTRRRGK